MLELQNDDIYELVIDNSYFIFIGNDSFNEEIDYFSELRVQQPFSIITDSDNKYSKFGEVLLSADTKSNKDAFINDVIERISKVDNVFRACLETHLSIMKRFNSMLAMAI